MRKMTPRFLNLTTDTTVSKRLLLGMGLFTLVALLCIWLLTFAIRVSFTKTLPSDVEVRKNPFLALEKLAEVYGDQVTTHRDFSLFDAPLDPQEIVVITNSRKPLSPTRLERLYDFVDQGGFLILAAEEFFDDDAGSSGAPILDELGARLYSNDGEIERESLDNDYESKIERMFSANVSTLEFNDEPKPIQVQFDDSYYLIDASGDAFYIAGSEENHHLLKYHYGEGIITVLSDVDFWSNSEIDRFDHAYFFRMFSEGQSVRIIYNPQVPSLANLTWAHASYVVISLFVFIVAVIWFKQIKTGPVFPQFSSDSRKLIQHLEASAEFKTRFCGLNLLLEQAKTELFRKISRRHHKFLELPPAQQINVMKDMTKVPESSLEVLYKSTEDSQIFTQQISLIQTLRLKIDGKNYER